MARTRGERGANRPSSATAAAVLEFSQWRKLLRQGRLLADGVPRWCAAADSLSPRSRPQFAFYPRLHHKRAGGRERPQRLSAVVWSRVNSTGALSDGGRFSDPPCNEELDGVTMRLNDRGYQYAKRLIDEGKFVYDLREDWSEHHLSTRLENEFIEKHGFVEYANWFLAVKDEYGEDTRRRYEFPHGDFENAHRCALLAAKSRASQYKHFDVENAAADLVAMIDSRERE
jgi:hypothetical protein